MFNEIRDKSYGTSKIITRVSGVKVNDQQNIKEMQNFYNKYYIPNNMAICLSGDLDIQNTISLIEK